MKERTRQQIDKRLANLKKKRTDEDRAFVDRQWAHIDGALRAMSHSADSETHELIEDGIAAALALGFFHYGASALVKKDTGPATDASRRPQNMTDILQRRARDFRSKRRQCSASAVASGIYQDVARDVDELPKPPRRWEPYWQAGLPNLPTTDALAKKFIVSIRRALERM